MTELLLAEADLGSWGVTVLERKLGDFCSHLSVCGPFNSFMLWGRVFILQSCPKY